MKMINAKPYWPDFIYVPENRDNDEMLVKVITFSSTSSKEFKLIIWQKKGMHIMWRCPGFLYLVVIFNLFPLLNF